MTQDFLPGGGVVRPASETSGNGPLPFRRNEPTFPQRLPIRPAPPVVWHQSNCPLPYFAHQTLDLKYFPADIAQSVGGPIAEAEGGAANQAWDDEESDRGADLESDADDDMPFESTNAKPKNARKTKRVRFPNSGDMKKMKIVGGRPAVAKKVTADLDSDDELIVRMKEARFLEKDIAQALIDEGRTAYNPKTIGTRWRRIKTAISKRTDDLLDADLTDWHEGDDDVLLQAFIKADKEVKRRIDDIESRRWRIVADKMKNLKPVTNFSQHACRNRYEALQLGTAKPTPESIPDPSPEILTRIQARKSKELRLLAHQQMSSAMEQQNLEANGWTSRTPEHVG